MNRRNDEVLENQREQWKHLLLAVIALFVDSFDI